MIISLDNMAEHKTFHVLEALEAGPAKKAPVLHDRLRTLGRSSRIARLSSVTLPCAVVAAVEYCVERKL